MLSLVVLSLNLATAGIQVSYIYDQVIKYLFLYFYIGLFCQALHSFSIIRNVQSIMRTHIGNSDLTYLHGIRVLSLFWIILYHITVFTVESFWPYGK